MSSDRFTTVIDLTSRGLRQQQQAEAAKAFSEPENALPDATPESLPERLQQALQAAGWDQLMPVQEKAIPYMLDRRDMIVQSRTGSGKTGAFLLPLFDLLDPARREPQALILAPTRELARQIHAEFIRMQSDADEGDQLEAVLVYGGVKYGPQTQALKGGAQVVIGTPGRVLDLLERNTFSLNKLRAFILDEADEMLSMGFYPAMRQLKRYLPQERLSYMFSATMPPKVQALGREFLNQPGFLSLSAGQESVDAIEHRYYLVDAMDKDRALVRLIEMENPDSAIIFANTKRDVEYLATFLRNYGHHADEISGDLTQNAREEVMGRIHRGELRFLVATDVAARGIDISDLGYVFLYDVPQDPEYYIHRSGRTARAGKEGVAITLATVPDKHSLLRIARKYGFEVEERALPTQEEVAARIDERLTVMLETRLRERTNLERERMSRFVPLVESLAQEEPELLAMLLDELYHTALHESDDQPAPAAERLEKPKRRPKGGRGGRR